MIQNRPRCFDCEEVVEHDPVYAPPMCDHEDCSSAVFHGLCLMTWRERRQARFAEIAEARQAFLRHVSGECGCPPAA